MTKKPRDFSDIALHRLRDATRAQAVPEAIMSMQVCRQASTPDWGAIPVARTLDPAGTVMGFDPWYMQANRLIGARSLALTGSINSGKSATAIVISGMLAARRAANSERTRILTFSRKMSGDKPEFYEMIQALGGMQIDMDRNNFNFFEAALGISQSGLHSLIVMIAEDSGISLSAFSHKAIAVALHVMAREAVAQKRDGNMHWLHYRLITLSDKQIVDYETSSQLVEEVPEEVRVGEVLTNHEQVKTAAAEVATALENFMFKYSGVFSGTDSLADALASHAVSFNFTGQDSELRPFTHLLLMRVRSLVTNPRYTAHIIISDENYEDWRMPLYARYQSVALKKIRESKTFHVMIFHALRDFRTVGSESSEHRLQAIAALNDVALFAIGRTEKLEDAKDMQELLRFSDITLERIMNQRVGQFTFIPSGRNSVPVQVQFDLTKIEEFVTYTEAANASMIRGDR